jgi:DNA-binding MarR family transcriptional regulator
MATNSRSENTVSRLWFMIHRTHNMLKACEDQVFSKHKITTEQYVVLVTIKYLGKHVRPTDVARLLAHSPNSVSMIVDRMVKAGLLRRIRDRRDRRVVFLIITAKAERILKPALVSGWEFVEKVLSPLSSGDRKDFLKLLLTVQYEACKQLNPGEDVAEGKRNGTKCQDDDLAKRLNRYALPSIRGLERLGGERRMTAR